MPASFLLITDDKSLLESWSKQIPRGRPLLNLEQVKSFGSVPAGVSIVIVLDALKADVVPGGLGRCPLVLVGKKHTPAFEALKAGGQARCSLNYEESRTQLVAYIGLLEEVAERGAALEILADKSRRPSLSRPPMLPASAGSQLPVEIWDFLEGAVENISSRERLLAEFRRASRHLLRASHTVFFLREDMEFRADRGASQCSVHDPMISYLSTHPVVLDGEEWPSPSDPLAEMAVRNQMAIWGARLLVPMHDNGHLVGIISCGVRDDGQPYDENDKSRAISVARLLRQLVGQNQHYSRLERLYRDSLVGDRYLPSRIVLGRDEAPSRQVPLVVRTLIDRVRYEGENQFLRPSAGQPFRASAGVVPETGGVWATWEEASGEVYDLTQTKREERLALLRDLSLTLNHEIGNALVSLTSLQHLDSGKPIPPRMAQTILQDLERLRRLNEDLAAMGNLEECDEELTDIGQMLTELAKDLDVKLELPRTVVELKVVSPMLSFALESLVRTVQENRPTDVVAPLVLQLRSTGEGEQTTALISIQGSNLELEGIIPVSNATDTPNQGRLTVFIAKEILRLHGGSIHAGPGMAGNEILMSVKCW
ncbi:hypothetical protein [Actomonas aquatica]|uniref:GAF domain-containing protein n=1 Tax=Actomonas aquatica TaxID=2866162 RepID=A0ABZ1CDR7_9BACT|nr:hypothetical protein [Opitutus sp. WL0086]WRQ88779.1 hypothetical protein K1X11_005140 [Opitutus sp. WL0086]